MKEIDRLEKTTYYKNYNEMISEQQSIIDQEPDNIDMRYVLLISKFQKDFIEPLCVYKDKKTKLLLLNYIISQEKKKKTFMVFLQLKKCYDLLSQQISLINDFKKCNKTH